MTDKAQGSSKLSAAEVADVADSSPRANTTDTTGDRVRAIPAKGGTTIQVSKADFAAAGIDHATVTFDFRKDHFTLPVGKGQGLTKEAADFLTKNYPTSFEYMTK